MIDTNYGIDALDVLLRKDCVSERYYPLIAKKTFLIGNLRELGCVRKEDAQALSDEALALAGLKNADGVRLFRRFLRIYDPATAKFREIEKSAADPAQKASFRELYYLPGVKEIRADLYYRSGFRALADIAAAAEEEILRKTADTIAREGLSCIVPLPKEVRTHIAVAKAFTGFLAM